MPTILLIQDETSAAATEAALGEVREQGWPVVTIHGVADGIEYLLREPTDCVILDLDLPQTTDLDTFNRLQNVASHVPVVVLTTPEGEQHALLWIHAGAQDYLVKGEFDSRSMLRSIRCALERRQIRNELSRLAQYDPLSGLPNRALFRDRLRQALARSARESVPLAVLFMDLDDFKSANDTLGHDVGDLLLRTVSERLVGCVRRTDTVARMAGDEFTAIIECPTGIPAAAHVAEKIRSTLARPFVLNGHTIQISVSIGIAMAPSVDADPAMADRLLKRADMAMYRSKRQGGNRFQFHSSDMSRELAAQVALERDLQHALPRGEFVLHYQPQFALRDRSPIGLEALLRWRHPKRGLLHPGAFLRTTEDTGLILQVGEWVLRTACQQAAKWDAAGVSSLPLAINLSNLQLRQPDMGPLLARTLAETGWDAHRLELEFTEAGLMGFDRAHETLAPLTALGVRIALDDFGAGLSSLQAVKRLPLSTLKLDPTLTHAVTEGPQDAAVVAAAIALGHALDLRTVAEGLETPEQIAHLVELGCDAGQGYILHPPESAEAITDWLRNRGSAAVA